ncbi:hypothetical protein [Nostoc cycadae]|uniref:hypothetical protein n=1 Tax=Nostoc cycadae TaxID=246795 RepID=UPI00165103F4|nr:hypothetical protein [Nostoc cycadae]
MDSCADATVPISGYLITRKIYSGGRTLVYWVFIMLTNSPLSSNSLWNYLHAIA